MRFVSLSHYIIIYENITSHPCGPRYLQQLLWISIIRQHIFIILENSSQSFRHWIETHMVIFTTDIDTHPFGAALKMLEFWRNEANSDHISRNLTHLPMPHFNTLLYRIGSRTPTRINSTFSSTLDYCFKARIWPILTIGHCDRSRIFWIYSHDRKPHGCIKRTSDLPVKSHSRLRFDSLLRIF